MEESYCVRLDKPSLVFSAAHFITFNGNICERLHGHNYRVAAEIFGPLDENHYVADFIALLKMMQDILAELDHRVLLPTRHSQIHVAADDREVTAQFEDRRWVFPRGDCILLPVENTTAELLAHYIGRRLLKDINQQLGQRPRLTRIHVDENFGQWGVCELSDR